MQLLLRAIISTQLLCLRRDFVRVIRCQQYFSVCVAQPNDLTSQTVNCVDRMNWANDRKVNFFNFFWLHYTTLIALQLPLYLRAFAHATQTLYRSQFTLASN